ncbi:MAG: hypothetical protein EPN84_08265, partial [Legionella sp.]
MLIQALVGVVEQVSGVVAHTKPNGEVSLAKQGTQIREGDYLTLLSGEAYIHMIEGFPQALSLNKPFIADGTSPLLTTAADGTLVETIVQEALAAGIDPAQVLASLEATAATGAQTSSGGREIVRVDPNFSLGRVEAGYPTGPFGLGVNGAILQNWFYGKPEESDVIAVTNFLKVEEDALNPGNKEVGTDQQTTRTVTLVGGSGFILDEQGGNLGDLPQLTSNGSPIQYKITGFTDLTAYIDVPGNNEGENPPTQEVIFTVHLEADGVLTFTLIGQIDHPNPDDNPELTGDAQLIGIDLSPVIAASGAFLPPGSVIVFVEDDMPIATINLNETLGIVLDESIRPHAITDTNATADNISMSNPDPFGGSYGTPIGASSGSLVNKTGSSPGGDNKGATELYSLSINGGADSGLKMVTGPFTSTPILLSMDGDNIVGKTAGGTVVFAIKIDALTGEVSVAQYEAIAHPNQFPFSGPNRDEPVNLNGKINAIVTVTDGDKDQATAQVDIGNKIIFQDDAPIFNNDLLGDVGEAVLDETNLVNNPNMPPSISTTIDLTSVFTPAVDYGTDKEGALIYLLFLDNADHTDEGVNVQSGLFALDPSDTAADAVDGDGYGKGVEIVMNVTHQDTTDTVTGTVGTTTYFTIVIDNFTGALTFTQFAPIWHSDTGNADDTSSLNALAGSLYVLAQAIDGDRDSAFSDIIDISQGVFKIEDDGPSINSDAIAVAGNVEEDAMSTTAISPYPGDSSEGNQDLSGDDNSQDEVKGNAGSLTDLFNSGADAPLTIQLLTDTSGLPKLLSHGQPVTYTVLGDTLIATVEYNNGSAVITTTVFNLQVNSDGSWTFDLQDQLDHVPGEGQNFKLQVVDGDPVDFIELGSLIQATDADGDKVSGLAGNKFIITVEDDVPVVKTNATAITATVEEDGMSTTEFSPYPADSSEGNQDLIDDSNSQDEATGAAGSLISLFSAGADESLTIQLLTNTDGLPKLLSHGQPVTYTVVGDTLTASVNATTVFTLKVNADGSWTFDLQDQLDHVPGLGQNFKLQVEDGDPVDYIELGSLIQATDADGDKVSGLAGNKFIITVEDDVPTAEIILNPNKTITLDESLFADVNDPNAATDDHFLPPTIFGFPIGQATANVISSAANSVNVGADDQGSTSVLSLVVNQSASGLKTTNGTDIYLFAVDSDTVVGRAGNNPNGQVILQFDLDQNGNLTVTQYDSLKHPSPGNGSNNTYDEPVTLGNGILSAKVIVTDADGDTATDTQDLGGLISIEDDGPTADIKLMPHSPAP